MRDVYASGKRPGQLWWVHAHSVHSAPMLTYGSKASGKRSVGFGNIQNSNIVQQWMSGAKNKEKAKTEAKLSAADKTKMVIFPDGVICIIVPKYPAA